MYDVRTQSSIPALVAQYAYQSELYEFITVGTKTVSVSLTDYVQGFCDKSYLLISTS